MTMFTGVGSDHVHRCGVLAMFTQVWVVTIFTGVGSDHVHRCGVLAMFTQVWVVTIFTGVGSVTHITHSLTSQSASLLDALGLPCLQSCGEAEALCVLLNITGVSVIGEGMGGWCCGDGECDWGGDGWVVLWRW